MPPARPPKVQPPTPRKAARLLMSEPDKLSEDDRRFVTTLLELSPPIARAVDLARAFSTMIKQSLADQLDGWIAAAETGGFKGFAGSLRQDRDAVHAALTLPWSTGGADQPAEGHQALHVRPRRIRPSAPPSTCRRIGENQAENFFQKLCTQKNEEPRNIPSSRMPPAATSWRSDGHGIINNAELAHKVLCSGPRGNHKSVMIITHSGSLQRIQCCHRVAAQFVGDQSR
jgi:hypothetical protein